MARPRLDTVEKKMVRGISLTDQQSAMLDILSRPNGNNRSLTVQKWIDKEWALLSREVRAELEPDEVEEGVEIEA